jgi:hypothetical protein
MAVLRGLAVVFGLTAMTGEALRSWGVGHPIAFRMDDVVMGMLLLAGALATVALVASIVAPDAAPDAAPYPLDDRSRG